MVGVQAEGLGGIDDDKEMTDAARLVRVVVHRPDLRAEGAAGQHPCQEIDREREPVALVAADRQDRSEEHTSELQSLMRISYASFCLTKKKKKTNKTKPDTKTQS